ncbi:cilia- and flagella-associated protein 184 [Tenrec ecaudatus]|uniref:cilia- and flagella-associated protein 184 n=1 Tax=Tenrec ecaudatus TaxID=94439 RepID=UPI003F5976DF
MEGDAEDPEGSESPSLRPQGPSPGPETPAEAAEPSIAELSGGDAATELEVLEESADVGAGAEAEAEPRSSGEPEATLNEAETEPQTEAEATLGEPEAEAEPEEQRAGPGTEAELEAEEQPAGPGPEASSEGPGVELAESWSASLLAVLPAVADAVEQEAESSPLEEEGTRNDAQADVASSRFRQWSYSTRGSGEEWSEEVKQQHEQQLRSELLEQYRALLAERNRCQRYNSYLQHKIHDALRKKKGLDAAEVPDRPEPEAPEKEQAYLRYLAKLEELKKQLAEDLDWYHQELAQLQKQCREKLSQVDKDWRAFQAVKKQVVLQAMGSCWLRGGRQAALREVEAIQALEDKKEKEMRAVRLENVQLRQSLMHFETRMRTQEDLTQGLLLIDFEQLKIENQTFNEKVEERGEELLKLRNKVTDNVQVVTHVKEKLHFVEAENTAKKAQLQELEALVAHRRDVLTQTKKARDRLRLDNIKLSQKCGLLGRDLLLQDMEEKMKQAEQLNQRLEALKRHHAGLSMSCKGVKQKIREARAFLPS